MNLPHKNKFEELTNLESIKEFCNTNLFDIANGILKTENHSIKVRFIDSNQKSRSDIQKV